MSRRRAPIGTSPKSRRNAGADLRDTDSVSKQEADEKISFAASTAAQLRSAEANVQRLREMYGFEKIVAPFAGVVTARNTDVGQLINAGSSSGPELFRIADTRRAAGLRPCAADLRGGHEARPRRQGWFSGPTRKELRSDARAHIERNRRRLPDAARAANDRQHEE